MSITEDMSVHERLSRDADRQTYDYSNREFHPNRSSTILNALDVVVQSLMLPNLGWDIKMMEPELIELQHTILKRLPNMSPPMEFENPAVWNEDKFGFHYLHHKARIETDLEIMLSKLALIEEVSHNINILHFICSNKPTAFPIFASSLITPSLY
jgi:hypothetical protein